MTASEEIVIPNPCPQFSLAESDQLQVRVDSSTFMDSVYIYDGSEYNESTKKMEFSIRLLVYVKNGITRPLEYVVGEDVQEFYDKVATPVFNEIVRQLSESQKDN